MRQIIAIILNFIGGTVRYLYGSVWRFLLNKKRFTYSDYLNGIKNSDSWYDSGGHAFVNYIVGLISFVILIWLFSKIRF